MKKILYVLAVLWQFMSLSANAQAVNSCGFKVPPRSLIAKFQSVYEAGDIVKSMLNSINWKENFSLREQNGINNAYATILQSKRWIVYDNDFLENLDSYASTKWASISVLAHEMGHHYYNHMVNGKGSTPPIELEADAFCGFLMQKMGASLDQSVAAIKTIASDKGSSTHPGKADRVNAITNGWNKAYNQSSTTSLPPQQPTAPPATPGNNGNPVPNNPAPNSPNPANTDPATDPSWIALSVQSNQTETVYLSDDGRKFEPVEIKAGQPFIFKFEIYNYGWLKLPYFNGARVFKLLHGKDYLVLYNRRTKNWTVTEVPE